MKNKDVLKKLNQVAEDFNWQLGKVPTDYVNGYLQGVRDCKKPFYGLEKEPEVVHCGECIYWGNVNCSFIDTTKKKSCLFSRFMTDKNEFCSFGKKVKQ